MVVLVLAHVAIFLLKHGTVRNFDMMQLRQNQPRPLVILEFEITLQVVIGEYFSVEKERLGKTSLPTLTGWKLMTVQGPTVAMVQ